MEYLRVEKITKVFKLSKKQMLVDKTTCNKKIAVNNLSFTANKGEIFGLLGSNGAGKTTTLRMLATLIKPDSGSAFIDGIDVVKNEVQIRGKIGFLTSELKLEEFFTPNYLYDFFSNLHNVEASKREQRKSELFAKFGIDKFAHVKVSELSTGMKQKISLVISIVHDPDFIIFDEPTNGLDVITAKTVTDFLLELKKQNKTIILSTHIFSLVEKICDRVGIIIDGSMALVGDIETLTEEKCLEDVFFDLYQEKAVANE